MDEKINKMVLGFMKFGILIHMGFACWIFSNPYFFPKEDFFTKDASNNYYLEDTY